MQRGTVKADSHAKGSIMSLDPLESRVALLCLCNHGLLHTPSTRKLVDLGRARHQDCNALFHMRSIGEEAVSSSQTSARAQQEVCGRQHESVAYQSSSTRQLEATARSTGFVHDWRVA